MSETNHTNAGAEAPLKTGAPETGAPKANIWRRFPSWSFIDLGSYSVPLSDGTYIFATIENCTDPCDPRLYFAEVIRGIPTGNGTRYERLKGRSFNDLIQALLYLESVDLVECEIITKE